MVYIILIFALLVAAACMTFLVRGLVLFPFAAHRYGALAASSRYGLSVLFSLGCLVYSVYAWTNVYGFSRKHLRWLSNSELIDAAITYRFRGKYKTLSDLRKDYPGFTPSVDYYFSHYINEYEYYTFARLMGDNTYRIKLPDSWVLMTADGEGYETDLAQRTDRIAPVTPKFGVVIYVFLEDWQKGTVTPFTPSRVRWDVGEGPIVQKGNCLSAESKSAEAEVLYNMEGIDALMTSNGFSKSFDGQDFFVVYNRGVKGRPNQGGGKVEAITEEKFQSLKTCDNPPQVYPKN